MRLVVRLPAVRLAKTKKEAVWLTVRLMRLPSRQAIKVTYRRQTVLWPASNLARILSIIYLNIFESSN